jgi:hypothetical protein
VIGIEKNNGSGFKSATDDSLKRLVTFSLCNFNAALGGLTITTQKKL